jgi:tetratricopeptide (TPR) repeat protein
VAFIVALAAAHFLKQPRKRGPEDFRRDVLNSAGNGQYPAALQAAQMWARFPGLTAAQRAEALSAGAKVRYFQGDYSGAAQDYSSALALVPDDPVAEYGLARALGDTPEKALPHAEKAAKNAATPLRRAAAWKLAGEIRLDLGDEVGARAAFTQALKSWPNDLEALRGMVRVNRSHPKEATAFAERAFEVAQTSPDWYQVDAFRFCARIWLEIKNHARAEDSLVRALARDKNDLDALELLVQLKHEGPWRPSILHPEAGSIPIRMPPADPEDLEALRREIAAALAAGRKKEAAALAERFTYAVDGAQAWMQAPAYLLITRTWLELGNNPMAQQTLWKLRDLDPRSLSTAKLGEEMKVPGPTVQDAQATVDRARAELTGAP